MKRLQLGSALMTAQILLAPTSAVFAGMYTNDPPRTPLRRWSELNNTTVLGTACILIVVTFAAAVALLILRYRNRKS